MLPFVEAPATECGAITSDGDCAFDPPLTGSEIFKDGLLRRLDSKPFKCIALINIIFVILVGAFVFHLNVGWHVMCDEPSKYDCDTRNWWVNVGIQILTAQFTYMNAVTMPFRCANALHTFGWSCPRRSNEIGMDTHGRPNADIWFHIPLRKRGVILVLLLLNCIFQFINQGTRCAFPSFDEASTTEGTIWTSAFFILSFLCAIVAGVITVFVERGIRKTNPEGTFPPSIFTRVKGVLCKKKIDGATTSDNNSVEGKETFPNNNSDEDEESVI